MKLTPLITDEQTLIAAFSRFDSPIPVYDDGFGELFIHRDSMGISGIVRAQSWHDAYGICEDEFFPAADDEAMEEMERIEAMEDGEEKNHEQACFDEAFGFRPNGGIYSKDLNGDRLDLLTPELLEELEIRLEIESPPVEDKHAGPYFSWHETRRPNGKGRTVFSMTGRHGIYSRITPGFVSRFHTLRNSHFSPNRAAHAIA
jgi:hypothetical protein